MYKVKHLFTDKEDGHVYRPGDVFPEEGRTDERLKELSGNGNALGKPLIYEVKAKKKEGEA